MFANCTQIDACRYLLALYVLDTLSWASACVMRLEVLLLAEELGVNSLRISLVITAVEVLAEFAASCSTVPLLRFTSGKEELSCRSLAKFALQAYLFSCSFAVVCYSALGYYVYVENVQTVGTLMALGAGGLYSTPY